MALFALLLLGIDAQVLALPRDPAPRPTLRAASRGELLVARARRRRSRRAAKPKPRPKAAPKALKADPGSEDDEPAASAGPSGPAPAGGMAATDPGALQRGGRVEFDGRLVQGQTAKSGAIYLFARQRTDLRSMVRERESYRKEVLRTVDPDWKQ